MEAQLATLLAQVAQTQGQRATSLQQQREHDEGQDQRPDLDDDRDQRRRQQQRLAKAAQPNRRRHVLATQSRYRFVARELYGVADLVR